MVYSTATGSLYNDVHPGDTSLNMTPWTTATLILACPLALRYADGVARFSLVSIAMDMLEPIGPANFLFEQPLPYTSFVLNISKQEHLVCFVGEGRDANKQKPFSPKFIPTKLARTVRCLGVCFYRCSEGIASRKSWAGVGKKKLKSSFCYTPRGWFHLPHFHHICSTVQSIKGRSVALSKWNLPLVTIGLTFSRRTMAQPVLGSFVLTTNIPCTEKKTSILPTSIRRSEIATYMSLPTQVAVPDLLSVVFALELVAGRRTKAQVKFRASS